MCVQKRVFGSVLIVSTPLNENHMTKSLKHNLNIVALISNISEIVLLAKTSNQVSSKSCKKIERAYENKDHK